MLELPEYFGGLSLAAARLAESVPSSSIEVAPVDLKTRQKVKAMQEL